MSSGNIGVQVCTICLDTDSGLYVMGHNEGRAYSDLTGHSLHSRHVTKYLCAECFHRLMSFKRFRLKSLIAHHVMEELVKAHDMVTLGHLKSIDRNTLNLTSNIVKAVLEPDYCDLYIENSDESKQSDTSPSQATIDSAGGSVDAKSEKGNTKVNVKVNDTCREIETNRVFHNLTKSNRTELDGDFGDIETVNAGKDEELVNESATDSKTDLNSVVGNITVKSQQKCQADMNLDTSEHIQIVDSDDSTGVDVTNDDHNSSDCTLVLDKVSVCDEQSLDCMDHTLNTDPKNHPISANDETQESQKDSSNVPQLKLQERLKFEPTQQYSTDFATHQRQSHGDDENMSLLVPRGEKRVPLVPGESADTSPYTCDTCGYKCKLKIRFNVHMETHSQRTFACEVCGYQCKLRHTLNVHMKKHADKTYTCGPPKTKHTHGKQFSCGSCEYTTADKEHLARHVSDKHAHNKPHSDKHGNKYALKKHIRPHTVEHRVSCTLCDYKCENRTLLALHVETHVRNKTTTGELYTCEMCESQFERSHQLESHMRTHAGGTRFTCTICKERFALEATLRKHMHAHSGGKPYRCTSKELARHARTHPGGGRLPRPRVALDERARARSASRASCATAAAPALATKN